MNLNEELGALFVEEARELLFETEQVLLALESSPDDEDLVAKLFRAVHTIKGNSRILGFVAIERFAHELESLLDKVRQHELRVTREITDVLLLCQDVLQDLVAEAAGQSAHDAGRYAAALRRVTGALAAPPTGVARVPTLPVPVASSRVAAAVSRLPPELRASLPAAARSVPVEPAVPAPEVEQTAPVPAPAVEQAAPVSAVEQAAPAPAPVEQPARSVAAALERPTPVVAPETKAVDADGAVSALPKRAPSTTHVEARRERPATGDGESSSVRVPIEKLDRLINLTGEVVIAQSIIAELVTNLTPERIGMLQEVVAQMDRHCRELQERMLGARMVPLRNVFGRFHRLVRDLAATTGKSLRLEVSGEDTELDKTVIEKIVDPLTHLVRNAVDHGVEDGPARLAAGKPVQACVKLAAYQKGGNIFIEVSDDGRGIDRAKVLAKARASGLVRSDAALTTDEIDALIFQPGFSTAAQVTELSGRGVGMDVVKRNVEALQGSITILSNLGAGTCFRIKLPLTLAILDGLAVRVGSEVYLVPLMVVSESLQPNANHVQRLPGAGEVVDIRGEYLPLIRLFQVFGQEPLHEHAHEAIVMILDDGSQKLALQVDELLGQYQVVIKSLETNFRTVPGIAGATVLGDGRVALILDVGGLRSLAPRSAARASTQTRMGRGMGQPEDNAV